VFVGADRDRVPSVGAGDIHHRGGESVDPERITANDGELRIPAIPYTQSGVFVHPGPTWVSEAA
jgi:hypothetical protein